MSVTNTDPPCDRRDPVARRSGSLAGHGIEAMATLTRRTEVARREPTRLEPIVAASRRGHKPLLALFRYSRDRAIGIEDSRAHVWPPVSRQNRNGVMVDLPANAHVEFFNMATIFARRPWYPMHRR